MKDLVYKLIDRFKFLQKIYLRYFNEINIDNFCFPGICFRNNKIEMKSNILHIEKNNEIYNFTICCIGNNNKISLGDTIKINGTQHMKFDIIGNNNEIIIGNNVNLNNFSIFIRGNNNIIYIFDNCSFVFTNFHIEQDNNNIVVGKSTTIHGREYKPVHFALDEGTSIIINEDCMISNNVIFRSTDSHSIIDFDGNRINKAKNIIIGKHCWIGLNALILKGVIINDNNMVASGSICTKIFNEKNTIIGGNPAKVIKRNINWDRKFI